MHWAVLVAEHWPQAPDVWQAGVVPPHSPSPAQARQMCVAVLQTGLVPPHSALVMQFTQVPVGTSQAGVVPVQRLVLVAEQMPQAPEAWQAGVAPVPQSPSPEQPRQVWVPPSQIGVVPLQSALARQRTHLPAPVSQSGVAPVHCVLLLAEHWPQAPEPSQAGVAPPHSVSPEQARQVWKAKSQTGVDPPQSASAVQRTQVPDGV